MTIITRPVTDDGLVGYDQFGQFVVEWEERGGRTSTFMKDVRGKTCRICNQQWQDNGPSIKDQMHWRLIDDFVHQSCYTRWLGLVERSEFQTMLVDSGIRFYGLKEQPNRYWGPGHELGRPWYYAELVTHPIRLDIGWRKRVISIALKPQGNTELAFYAEAEEAFKAEDVTKGFGPRAVELHAWGNDKAREYLKILAKLMGPGKEPEQR